MDEDIDAFERRYGEGAIGPSELTAEQQEQEKEGRRFYTRGLQIVNHVHSWGDTAMPTTALIPPNATPIATWRVKLKRSLKYDTTWRLYESGELWRQFDDDPIASGPVFLNHTSRELQLFTSPAEVEAWADSSRMFKYRRSGIGA
jgi:hypothetical protein